MELTHASFFSGVGGLDLGLERAGWRTVCHSEIDPYASAVLAHHWPHVPNLGDIIALADAESRAADEQGGRDIGDGADNTDAGRAARERIPDPSRRELSAGRIAGDGPAVPPRGAATDRGDPRRDLADRSQGGDEDGWLDGVWHPGGRDPQGPAGTGRDGGPVGDRGVQLDGRKQKPRRRTAKSAAAGGDGSGHPVGPGDRPPVHPPADELIEGLQGPPDGPREPGDGGWTEPGQPGRRLAGDWRSATLWSGGFPCQDLSIAGKRSGFTGDRSSLAFIFLDLVEQYRPRAILLENVPGLLSSNGGRDMARLLREVAELGYGVAWRSLDAQHFGVPQRRQRIFVCALRSGADDPDGHLAALRAAEVLAVGTRCGRHPAKGSAEGEEAADGPRTGLEIAGGLTRRYGKGVNTTLDDGALVVRPPADPGGDGTADESAGRLDDRAGVATYYLAPETGQGADLTAHEVDQAPALTVTEFERSTDRGIRVVNGGVALPLLSKPNSSHAADLDTYVVTGLPPRRHLGNPYNRSDLTKEVSPTLSSEEPPMVQVTGINGDEQAQTLRGFGHGWQGQQNDTNSVFVKRHRAESDKDPETWAPDDVAPTLNNFDVGASRATTLVAPTVNSNQSGGWRFDADQAESLVLASQDGQEEDLLPVGLDSNRYRACGNAVVSNVAEWIGWQLREVLEDE